MRYFKILGREPSEADYQEFAGKQFLKFDSRMVSQAIQASVKDIWATLEGQIPAVSAFDLDKRTLILDQINAMGPQINEYFRISAGFGFGYESGISWSTLFQFLPTLLSNANVGQALFARLRAMDSVYLHQFANYLEALWETYTGNARSGMEFTGGLRNAGYVERFSREEESILLTELSKLTDLFRYAQLVKDSSRTRAEFHGTAEIAIKGAWNPYATKPAAEQVRNDVTLSPETPVELLSGSNMSGKTFYQRAMIWALLEALSTGHAPGNVRMPILSKIFFLDRVTGKLHRTLSAFGQEVDLWKILENLIRQDDGPMVVTLDEAWSTTSPGYQSALSAAVAQFGLEQGLLAVIASHNHDFLARFSATHGPKVRTAHFRTHLDAKGAPIYDYVKQEGHRLSNAIMAAQRMGLNELIAEIPDLIENDETKGNPR